MVYGLDSNILCYALDPAFPENTSCKRFLLGATAESKIGLNPTIIHETYHTLVFSQKWVPSEARRRLLVTLQHPYVEFYNQSRRISVVALDIATHYQLGGRDSLVIANFMVNDVPVLYTRDRELLRLRRMNWKRSTIGFEDPVKTQI